MADLWRSEVNFHVKRKTKMEALKTICASSAAARVTLEKSVRNLEVPGTLKMDFMVSHDDA